MECKQLLSKFSISSHKLQLKNITYLKYCNYFKYRSVYYTSCLSLMQNSLFENYIMDVLLLSLTFSQLNSSEGLNRQQKYLRKGNISIWFYSREHLTAQLYCHFYIKGQDNMHPSFKSPSHCLLVTVTDSNSRLTAR